MNWERIFSECVKGRKYIIRAYFMLSHKPVWERDSHVDFCIFAGSRERETGTVGTLFQPPVAGCCWRNSSFRLLCRWPFSDMQHLGKGCLYSRHVIQEPQNCPNPDYGCSVARANGCNINTFSFSLIIFVFLEHQQNAHDPHFLKDRL